MDEDFQGNLPRGFGLLKPGGIEGLGSEAVQHVSRICPVDSSTSRMAPLVYPFLQGGPHLLHATNWLILPLFPIPNNERRNLIGSVNIHHFCLGRIPNPLEDLPEQVTLLFSDSFLLQPSPSRYSVVILYSAAMIRFSSFGGRKDPTVFHQNFWC